MDHIATIKALGGPKAVADALRARGVVVADVTARSWTLNGRAIPSKYWAHIRAIGAEKKVPVSSDALAQQVSA